MEVRGLEEGARLERRDFLGAVSFGVFLFLVGLIFFITPNLYRAVETFFRDFQLVEIAQNIFVPASMSNHPLLYLAVEVFCYLWGLFQIVVLVVRFVLGSSISRKARTLSSIIFWFGAGWLTAMLATQTFGIGSRGWFAFWSAIAILLGLSLILQAIVLAAAVYSRPR